jgi:hypothetical protein
MRRLDAILTALLVGAARLFGRDAALKMEGRRRVTLALKGRPVR